MSGVRMSVTKELTTVAKCAPYDERDGQVHDVPAQDEVPETLDHVWISPGAPL